MRFLLEIVRRIRARVLPGFAVSVKLNSADFQRGGFIAHRGQFVLISSVFAFLNGMGTIPYAMSKAAVEQLGRGLRVELATHGVSTTVAYFSLIETNMIKHGVDDDPIVDELLAALPRALTQGGHRVNAPSRQALRSSRPSSAGSGAPARTAAAVGH